MSVVDEIKARLDIVAYIQQYAPLKKAGRNYKACCPFHNEKTPSFVVNPDNQSWRCFGSCSEGGDVFSFAMKQNGWTFGEALRELGKKVGVEVESRTPEQSARDEHLDKLRGLMKEAAEFYHKRLLNSNDKDAAATLRYVHEKRGLNDRTIQAFQIGYAPPGWDNLLKHLTELGHSQDDILEVGLASKNDAGRVYDRFRNRLMIPIRDSRGRVIGFGARALAPDDEPKYLNSPQTPLFDKSRTLFALDAAKPSIRETGTAVIVEGYMDAIQAHQFGFTNVIAQMGTALTEPQLKLLAPRLAQKIVMALDSDAAGQNATKRSLEVARGALQADYGGRLSVDIRILQIPGAKDPDDLIRESPEQWAVLVSEAVSVAEFVIETEIAKLPPNPSLHEREALARTLLPILIASEDNLYRQDNLQKLAMKLHIMERDLLKWADEQRRIQQAPAPKRSPQAPRSSDEPPDLPPIDYDSLEPPPDDEDELNTPTTTSPKRYIVGDITPEAYCLRMLFRQPNLLYMVNRELRSLAADNGALLNGPLSDLDAKDFSRSDYRALLQVFQTAIDQDDMEPMEYLEEHLDSFLVTLLEEILQDEFDDVRSRVRYRLSADTVDYWKVHEKRVIVGRDFRGEVVESVLNLRLQRLHREFDEMRFLLAEAQTSGEKDAISGRFKLNGDAKQRIESALQRRSVVRFS